MNHLWNPHMDEPKHKQFMFLHREFFLRKVWSVTDWCSHPSHAVIICCWHWWVQSQTLDFTHQWQSRFVFLHLSIFSLMVDIHKMFTKLGCKCSESWTCLLKALSFVNLVAISNFCEHVTLQQCRENSCNWQLRQGNLRMDWSVHSLWKSWTVMVKKTLRVEGSQSWLHCSTLEAPLELT